jgi:hypothetical protein
LEDDLDLSPLLAETAATKTEKVLSRQPDLTARRFN